MFTPRHRREVCTWLTAMFVCWLGCVSPAIAQYRDDYEGPDITWKLAGADCGVKVTRHQRSLNDFHTGNGAEQIQFTAGRGTFIHYAVPLERAPIIPELVPSIWIKADRPRLRLMAEVVLPRTLDENTGRPLTTVLKGSEYTDAGAWQRLSVPNAMLLLQRETIVLRRQLGPHVDPGEAYVSALILNVYGGPGETNIWLDDLEVLGVMDERWAENAVPQAPDGRYDPDKQAQRAANARPVRIDGSVLRLEGRPFFLRAIDYQGEAWEFLRDLGLNAVRFSQPPTPQQHAEAKRVGLRIIAPPPDPRAETGANEKLDHVAAWLVGDQLQSADLGSLRELAAETRAHDRTLRRPIACGALGDWWSFGRECDLLVFEPGTLFGPRSYERLTDRAVQRWRSGRVGTPYWAEYPLSPSPALRDQLALLDPYGNIAPDYDLEQARLALYSLLAAGPRGIVFRSAGRLDGEDESAQHRSAVLRLLNHELKMLEPWLSGGTEPQEIHVGDPELRAFAVQTERSRLVYLMRRAGPNSYVLGRPLADSAVMTLPGTPAADRIFQLTADGLRQLHGPIGSSGAKITVPESGFASAIVITQDPLVMKHLTELSAQQRRTGVETRLRLAANRIVQTSLMIDQIRALVNVPPRTDSLLSDAQNVLTQADQLLARGDLTGCYRNARLVEQLTSQVRKVYWDAATSSFSNAGASPCCLMFDTLPAHVRLSASLSQGRWGPNALNAGDFENLEGLLHAGWRQHRLDSSAVPAVVELSPDRPRSGRTSLRMAASSHDPTAFRNEAEAIVSIRTAPLPLRRGQIVRIRGWYRISPVQGGNAPELIAEDTAGGFALAECFAGPSDWRSFTLYRAIVKDGPFTVRFALEGNGEVFLDDVSLEVAESGSIISAIPAQPRR